jgi:PAS domain S-box-containing protein
MASAKESLKDIIHALHAGLSIEAAKERFHEEIGTMSTQQLIEAEQSLIEDGLPPEEVARFCNVHVALVEDGLQQDSSGGEPEPIRRIRLDNGSIGGLSRRIRQAAEEAGDWRARIERIQASLSRLGNLERHYQLKENSIFPFLEKHGFPGPSRVMWEKDNEIRSLLKTAIARISAVNGQAEFGAFRGESLLPLLDEIDGMIQKEDEILLPAARDRLTGEEWARVAIDIDEVGLAFAVTPQPAGSAAPAATDAAHVATDAGPARDSGSVDQMNLGSGDLSAIEIAAMLNALPFDITFVDAEDRVRYFNEATERTFVRTRSVIGRRVQNCHPPQSIDAVQRILDSFRSGREDNCDFWFRHHGRLIHIRYFAVRDTTGEYIGTLEVTQDITELQHLEGEKRLADL